MRLHAGATQMAGETASAAAERRAALLQDDGLASDNEVNFSFHFQKTQRSCSPGPATAPCGAQCRAPRTGLTDSLLGMRARGSACMVASLRGAS